MNYEAILFDLDGVIIDTHDAVTELWQELAAQYNIQLSEQDFYQHIYGCSPQHTIKTLFTSLSEKQQIDFFSTIQMREPHLAFKEIPGAIKFLYDLKKQNIITALVTSGSMQRVNVVIKHFHLDECFNTFVTGGDIRHGKPNPECYLLAMQNLKQSPSVCIVFEDAVSGVKAAKAAGASCIGVQPAKNANILITAGAHSVVPDFTAVKFQAITPFDYKVLLDNYVGVDNVFSIKKQGQQ